MYKVEVYVQNEWVGNQLIFKTLEEAEKYAQELFIKWTAVQKYKVIEVEVK